MGVLASILQPAGYYDDDEPPEGWESLPYASLFDLEDEGDFNKLRRVWKETKKADGRDSRPSGS